MDNSTQYQSEHGHTTWWEFEYAISVTQVLIATAVWREAYPEEQDTRTNFEGVVNDVIDLVGSKYGYKLPKVELSSDARSVRVIGANVDNIPQDQAAKIVSLWIETLLTMVAKDVTDMLSGLSNNAVDQCVTTGEGEGITGSVKQLQSLYNTLMVQTRIYAPVYLDFDKDRKAGKTNFNITALRLLHIACGMVFGRLPDKSLDCGAVPLYSNAGDPAYIQDSNLVFSDAFVSFFTSGALPDFNDIYEYIPPNCRPVQHGAAREHHSGGPSAASNTPNITRANGKNDDDDMIDFCAGEQGNEAKPYEKPRTALPQYSSYDGGREGGRDVLAKGLGEIKLSSITSEERFRQAMQHKRTAERLLRRLQDLADEINNYTEPDLHQSEPNIEASGTSPPVAVPEVQSSGDSDEPTVNDNEIANAVMLNEGVTAIVEQDAPSAVASEQNAASGLQQPRPTSMSSANGDAVMDMDLTWLVIK